MVVMILSRSRIVTQLVLLAALTTTVTLAAGTGAYYATVVWRYQTILAEMPPAARREMQYLIDTDQDGTERFHALYEAYRDDGRGRRNPEFFRYITTLSAVVGGALVGGAVAVALARRISRPVVAVADAAAQVSAGNRSARVASGAASVEVDALIDSFNIMADKIEFYERERTIMTAGIAHELRNPLTVLKGRLHGLVDGVIEPQSDEADRLLRQVSHLSHLIEDLRTLSHADEGGFGMNFRDVHLDDVVREVVADLRNAADETEVALDGRYVAAPLFGDAMRLNQIVMNMLTNAINHSPPGGVVTITMTAADDMVAIDVLDEGTGFAPHDEVRSFIPFWRGSADVRLGRPGSGLGLALAARLAEAHGGKISAANRTDRSGAHFTLQLPLQRSEQSDGDSDQQQRDTPYFGPTNPLPDR